MTKQPPTLAGGCLVDCCIIFLLCCLIEIKIEIVSFDKLQVIRHRYLSVALGAEYKGY